MTSSPPPASSHAQDVMVVERNPTCRVAFAKLAGKLPGALYILDDLAAALRAVPQPPAGVWFVARQLMVDAATTALDEFQAMVVTHQVLLVVLLTKEDPAQGILGLGLPPHWYLRTPFPGETVVQLATGKIPSDDGVRLSGAAGAAWPHGAAALERVGALGAPLPSQDHPLMHRDVEQLEEHEVLGVAPDASRREIANAYLDLVRRFHPDLWASAADARLLAEVKAIHRRVTQAWSVLGNEEKRLVYREMKSGPRQSNPGRPRSG